MEMPPCFPIKHAAVNFLLHGNIFFENEVEKNMNKIKIKETVQQKMKISYYLLTTVSMKSREIENSS